MTFTFSIRTALRHSWQTFAKHPLFFSSMAFVMIIFNLFAQIHQHAGLIVVLVVAAAMIWSYVWINISLAAVDGKQDLLTFKSLSVHMPNVREFFTLVGVMLLVGIIVALAFIVPLAVGVFIVSLISFSYISVLAKILIVLGFMVLLIPGIYLTTRLLFAMISYVDQRGSVGKAIRRSWHITQGKIFWTIFLVLVVQIVLVLIGSLLLMIGLLVAYPLAALLMAQCYRAASTHYRQTTAAGKNP